MAAARRVLFAFAGQGSQFAGMASRFQGHSVYTQCMSECTGSFRRAGGVTPADIAAALADDAADLADTSVAQPVVAALQITAARAVATSGFQCIAAVGHSLGDIAAAYTAGFVTLDQAMAVVRHRSAVMSDCHGSMAVAKAPASTVRKLLSHAGLSDDVYVSGKNSPSNTTISGATAALQDATKALKASKVVARAVPVQYAFHSPLLTQEHEDRLAEALRPVFAGERRGGGAAWFPTGLLTQDELCCEHADAAALYAAKLAECDGGSALGAEYWAAQVRRPVSFEPAVSAAVARWSPEAAVECGAKPVVESFVRPAIKGGDVLQAADIVTAA
eukprot:TRINITY_DN10864_c0_g1_i1.p1 TRINITY_DN10864_c0_g1~~TRINITY_DN10864_c0_g1_i1.p1  ORF type:complete len:352 (+),score=119.28 TRINITY_DN10864_c0_g1_i1:61-1056(+)